MISSKVKNDIHRNILERHLINKKKTKLFKNIWHIKIMTSRIRLGRPLRNYEKIQSLFLELPPATNCWVRNDLSCRIKKPHSCYLLRNHAKYDHNRGYSQETQCKHFYLRYSVITFCCHDLRLLKIMKITNENSYSTWLLDCCVYTVFVKWLAIFEPSEVLFDQCAYACLWPSTFEWVHSCIHCLHCCKQHWLYAAAL